MIDDHGEMARLHWPELLQFIAYLLYVWVIGSSAPSVGSVPVSHLANVEALVQRAAAEAATRCAGGSAATSANGGGQMMDQHCGCIDRRLPSGVLPRGAPPSYAASTATMVSHMSNVKC